MIFCALSVFALYSAVWGCVLLLQTASKELTPLAFARSAPHHPRSLRGAGLRRGVAYSLKMGKDWLFFGFFTKPERFVVFLNVQEFYNIFL